MRLIAKVLRHILIPVLISVGLLAACDRYLTGTRSADYVVDSGVGMGKKWEDTREFAPQVKTDKLAEDGIHDPENDAIVVLQEPADAMAAFPQDRRGGVDWVRAIQLGIIDPRADVKGATQMVTMDMDVMLKDTGSMPWVKFPHLAHTQWLGCETCHPQIFVPQKGANDFSMDAIFAGEQCGRCHDKVAFALWVCERCHNTPHENSPGKWWQDGQPMQGNQPASSTSEAQ